MEVINSISNIKSESDFTSNEEYKKYLFENYRLILNELSVLKEKIDDYKKIQVELLKGINDTSEDTNNHNIMINDNISEDIEISELSEQTKDKSKIKKNTKKSESVADTEVVEDKPKAKKTTKKSESVVDEAIVVVSEVVEDKPKTKKNTKKSDTVATDADTVVTTAEEVVDKSKKKSNSVTEKSSKKSTKKSDSV